MAKKYFMGKGIEGSSNIGEDGFAESGWIFVSVSDVKDGRIKLENELIPQHGVIEVSTDCLVEITKDEYGAIYATAEEGDDVSHLVRNILKG